MLQLYNDVSYEISKIVTCTYSTSFSSAVSFLDREKRKAIYSIYGFVRLADEIVDTFHNYDKPALLKEFENDYYRAFKNGISLNPILHSFQNTVKKYNIDDDLIQAFLGSMKADLVKNGSYDRAEMDEYIYGSAEVVGLMCLNVFTGGDKHIYEDLKYPAMKLGSAFQKVNFLRDLKNDIHYLNRSYFPELASGKFGDEMKNRIIRDIEADFSSALPGIKKLPRGSKLPVLVAYYYYLGLLRRIKRTSSEKLLEKRISVPDIKKLVLLVKAWSAIKTGTV